MEYKNEFAVILPADLIESYGINEETLFEVFFDDGLIKIRVLDEDECDYDDDGCDIEDCIGCPYFCEKCGICTFDE